MSGTTVSATTAELTMPGQRGGNQSGKISPKMIASVRSRLEAGKRVRRTLPDGGRLHIDRALPFLCVYRQPEGYADAGTARLVTGEAAYLVAPGGERRHAGVTDLIRAVVETLSAQFGAFLLVELWAKHDAAAEADHRALDVEPVFKIAAPETSALDPTVDVLARHLKRLRVQKQTVRVDVERGTTQTAPGQPPLMDSDELRKLACLSLGIGVPPVYRDELNAPDREFPVLLKALRRSLGLALRRAYYDFTKRLTTHRPPHYHELGRRAVVKTVWRVDEELAAVSNQFDYLLNVTPINTGAAWAQFKGSDFERAPELHYLPLPFDPAILKRQLYRIPVERIEDPALSSLFLGKQEELDRKITMLRDRNTPRFLYGSLQLFGMAGGELFRQALDILEHATSRSPRTRSARVTAREFAEAAEREISRYREQWPEFEAKVVVTGNIPGVMVSRGDLLVGSDMELAGSRVDALLQHEVGTHLVTYYNGRSQPFRQLYSGLAGYEELQEGLAVLAEYLVDGLSAGRMRQLAGRVVAVRHAVDGANFVECFRSLVEDHGFRQRTAFNITIRVFRGGGFTKDVIYLRGLDRVLNLIRNDVDMDLLFVGKMAAEHLSLLNELRHRGVLRTIPVRPLFLERGESRQRLQKLRSSSATLADVVRETC